MNTQETTPDISSLVLAHGSHRDRSAGVCLLEAVAWVAGEPHTDHPSCCDVALAAFGRSMNDRLRDDERQALRDLVPRLVGTAGSPDLAKRRAYLLVDRHIRSVWPAFFRELDREAWAAKFDAVSPIVDAESAQAATAVLRAVREEARQARDEAWGKLTAKQRVAYAAAAAADDDDAAAAAYAAADDAAAAAYAAADDDDAERFRELRKKIIARSIEAFIEAIELS